LQNLKNRGNGIKILGKYELESKAGLCWTGVEKKKNQAKKNVIFSSCGVIPVGKLGCPVQPFVLKLGRSVFGNNLASQQQKTF